MCDEGAGVAYNARRAQHLMMLCKTLALDAIILITGFDGCYNLGSKGLVEWLCDCAATAATAAEFKAAALEEGLFIVMPTELAWFADEDTDSAAEDAVCALDRLMSDPEPAEPQTDSAAAGDVHMGGTTPTAAAAAAAAVAAAEHVESGMDMSMQQLPSGQVDGKLSLLLQLHPQLRRVGIAQGIEVRRGMQQQVPVEEVLRWPLLMAAAEQLRLPVEQLFQEVVDVTPSLRTLLGCADGTQLFNVLRYRRPLLTRAWLETLGVCGKRSASPKLDLTEAAVAAPVTEFVSGCGCRLKPGQYQPLALPPRVLFGTRTSLLEALSCPHTSLRSHAAHQGCAVLHATLEAADACSPLRVARTLFFSQGAGAADTPLQLRLQQQQQGQLGGDGDGAHAAAAGDDDGMCCCGSGGSNNGAGMCARQSQQQQQQEQQEQQEQSLQKLQQQQQQEEGQLPGSAALLPGGDFEVDHTDLFDLMCWYWAAVDAAWQGMEHYATQEGATWASTQAFASQVFWAAAAEAQLLQPPAQQQQQQQQQDTINTLSQQQQQQQGQDPQQQHPQQQQQQWRHRRPKLQLQLFSWDGGPRPMPSGTELQQHNSRFKTLRVTVSDIRSRSSAHPGKGLGSVLYMDSFVDVPAIGSSPPRLINLTLTHCPTYTFDFWGAEAAANNQRMPAFRRHLQLQLQAQLQAESQAQAAAMRRAVDDPSLLRMQLQQQGAKAAVRGGGQHRNAAAQQLQQQQQLLMMQQQLSASAAAGRGAGNGQQQQRGKGAAAGAQEAVAGRGSKHALGASSSSCCNGPQAFSTSPVDSNTQQAQKRSCCGSQPLASSNGPLSPGAFHPHHPMLPLDGLPAAAAAAAGTAAAAAGTTAAAPAAPAAAGAAAEGGSSDGRAAATAAAAAAATQSWRQLGRLLLPPGEMPGEVALVLTGAMKLAVMDGPLYAHSNGLVFVSRPTKVHVLLLDQIEAVWLQDFAGQLPGFPDLGPCVVLRGKQPCCGLLPAMHMTDNRHVAIPLRTMSKACSQHWVTVVLPAWQAAAGVVKASKGASSPWPLPAQYHPFYTYWFMGATKRYMLPQSDESIDQLVQLLDRQQQQQQQ